jgi:hypothetical protein
VGGRWDKWGRQCFTKIILGRECRAKSAKDRAYESFISLQSQQLLH